MAASTSRVNWPKPVHLWKGNILFRPAVCFSWGASDEGVSCTAILQRAVAEHAALKAEKELLPTGDAWPADIECTSSMGMTMEELVPLLDDEDTLWGVRFVSWRTETQPDDDRFDEQAAGMLRHRVAFEVDCGNQTLYIWACPGGRTDATLIGALRSSEAKPIPLDYPTLREARQIFAGIERPLPIGAPSSACCVHEFDDSKPLPKPILWRGLLRMPGKDGTSVDVLCDAKCCLYQQGFNLQVRWPKVLSCDRHTYVSSNEETRDLYKDGDVVFQFAWTGKGKKLNHLCAYLVPGNATFRIPCKGGILKLWSTPTAENCLSLFGTWRKVVEP